MGAIHATADQKRAQAIACVLNSFEHSATVQGSLKSRRLIIPVPALLKRGLSNVAFQAGTASVKTVAFWSGIRSADGISLSYSV
jgi:hypothetical protein